MLINEIIENSSIDAISLENIGIKGYACTYKQVIELIPIFRSNKIAILGGDVLVYGRGTIKLTYDSWYMTETEKNNYELTYKKTLEYMQIFENKEDFFYIVWLLGKCFNTSRERYPLPLYVKN